jgi:oxygen-independent coproporphyrinogen-3 oxidase
MDHFARPDDELAVAQREASCTAFQGYSTQADCDLVALGILAIGKVGATYSQNVRTLDEYYARLDADMLPCFRGWQLSTDDMLRRDVIQALMCQFTLSFRSVEVRHGIKFREYFAMDLDALRPLANDGLIELASDGITVTARGRLLVRCGCDEKSTVICASSERARYSRVI